MRTIHPIEARSLEILRSRVDLSELPPLRRAVTERVIHASADLEYVTDLVADEAHLRQGLRALRDGAPIVTDVAMVAAGITVWLGLVAQFGAASQTPETIPNELAVVQVQAGESLQQLAQRVAPEAPVGAVVDQIRELNELQSASLNAGQTLIAPIG